MKNVYLIISFTIFSAVFFNNSHAQCENVSLSNLTDPGPYQVETLTDNDGIRSGIDYSGATIYYPTNGTPPYSSIAIVPGFISLPSSVEDWGPFYASHGIVTIIIGTNSLFDSPQQRANALLDALETIKDENTRLLSPLNGALNLNQMAVSGWSMGGGGAQRAAEMDNSIDAVIALCPYLESPAINHDVPVLIFSGQFDAVAVPAQQADMHYAATPNTTNKVLYEVANGDHSVANSPNGGGGTVGKIALSWLKLYLEDNICYCPLLEDDLLDNPTEASKILQSFDCNNLSTGNEELNIGFYPNPTKNIVNFEILKDVQYEIISPLGQHVSQGVLMGNNKQIDFSQFPANVYFINIKGKVIRIIKQD